MLKVTSCSIGRMYRSGGGTRYDPSVHTLIECHWLRAARRKTHKPNLLLYYHKWSKGYMLAMWICKPRSGEGPGLFLDLEDLPSHPDKFTGKDAMSPALGMAVVRARLQPADEVMKERERREAREYYQKATNMEETERQRMDMAKWLARQGPKFETSARALRLGESGFVGDAEGGQELKDMQEFFRSLR